MPDLKIGEKSSEFLHIIHAATKMAFQYRTIKITPVLARNWSISKRYIANNLFKESTGRSFVETILKLQILKQHGLLIHLIEKSLEKVIDTAAIGLIIRA